MDAPFKPSYPHHTWLASRIAVASPYVFELFERRSTAHHLMLTVAGAADLHWSNRTTETTFHVVEGCLTFFPCDRELHALSITAGVGFCAYDIVIPERQIHPLTVVEDPTVGLSVKAFRDSMIVASVFRLASRAEGWGLSNGPGDEIAARQILARLGTVNGTQPPAWHADERVFAPAIMRELVDRIDARLVFPPQLGSLAAGVGLSPGHFARKFRCSVGMSLGRFQNCRRIGVSLGMLRDGSIPLARIALDLGFSSQSHFTRLFSVHTGLQPSRFRRQQLRMNGEP